MRQNDRLKFVIGLVLLFGGLSLALLLSHMSRLVGIALIMAGIAVLLSMPRSDTPGTGAKRPDNIASRIVRILTLNGRFKDAIPMAGIELLTLIAIYNALFSPSPYLGSNDYVALFLAGVLISYNLVPGKYSTERDFALLFGILLFLLLVIPTTILRLTSLGEDTNSPITYYLLAMPTAALSRLFGISVESPYMGWGYPVYNHMEIIGRDGLPILLRISLSCSGLYSVAIFVSAFISFVAVEYRKFDAKVAMLLGLGILLAWVANILRMTLIILVGYYRGADTMVWVHNNAGEFIFMAWVALFWWFMFRYFGVLDRRSRAPGSAPRAGRTRCALCGEPLSHTIPSSRCECGAISHSSCVLTNDMRCPSCGVLMDIQPGQII